MLQVWKVPAQVLLVRELELVAVWRPQADQIKELQTEFKNQIAFEMGALVQRL